MGRDMITLTKRLKQETETGGKVKKEEVSRVSIRDKLLVKEVQEMEENKPQYCKRRASGRGGGLNSMLRFLLSTTFFRPQSPASQGYGIQIFPKKEKYVSLSFDHTLWTVWVGHPPGDCEMCFGASPPSFLTCSTLKTRSTSRLLIISGVTRRDSGLKSETGL